MPRDLVQRAPESRDVLLIFASAWWRVVHPFQTRRNRLPFRSHSQTSALPGLAPGAASLAIPHRRHDPSLPGQHPRRNAATHRSDHIGFRIHTILQQYGLQKDRTKMYVCPFRNTVFTNPTHRPLQLNKRRNKHVKGYYSLLRYSNVGQRRQ